MRVLNTRETMAHDSQNLTDAKSKPTLETEETNTRAGFQGKWFFVLIGCCVYITQWDNVKFSSYRLAINTHRDGNGVDPTHIKKMNILTSAFSGLLSLPSTFIAIVYSWMSLLSLVLRLRRIIDRWNCRQEEADKNAHFQFHKCCFHSFVETCSRNYGSRKSSQVFDQELQCWGEYTLLFIIIIMINPRERVTLPPV